jgi:uncharacterized membrane protein
MALHFWRVRKDGGISCPQIQSATDKEKAAGGVLSKERKAGSMNKVHVWPHLVRVEFLVALAVMIILTVWSITIDAPLEGPANPTATPNPAKAPWYFAGLQELLVYFDPWIAGVVLPALIIVGLMVIPYVDVNPNGNGYYTFTERKFPISTFCFGFFVLWIGLIVIGVFFRGPGWNFFLPWQEWDTHKVVSSTNVNLSYLFGIRRYGPAAAFGGMVILGYYFLGVLYYLVHRKSETIQKLGVGRYTVIAFFFLTMMAIPIKIFLRLAFDVKYVLVTPWFYI